ncbi:glucose 1-dehydrogenase [Elysia marginata]|uniref:Glucose 1-dehydrogenase n=1 Tax=Elysia marginata TaxID=1093978 RepID=A0AAV4GRK0_9GAST|nr:glucose 1-dehydrogenase [Elysia marginata]
MSSLAGKSVIVTGSSSGIGEATAILFARKGCNVTLCGRDVGRLEEAAEKCREAGSSGGHSNRFITVAGDMTHCEVRRKVLEDTQKAFGGLDVLVVNHGVMQGGAFDQLSETEFDSTIDINLKSYVFLIKDAVPYLEKTKGAIVCVSSILSTLSGQNFLPYVLSKAATDHLVRCLALELGPKGIRINAVNPTVVKTRIVRHLRLKPEDPDVVDAWVGPNTPLGGQASGTEEQADAIAFLASEEARYITGQCLAVDGGMTCKGNPFNWFPKPASS